MRSPGGLETAHPFPMAYTLSTNAAEDLHRTKRRPSSLSSLPRCRPGSASVSRFIHDGTATIDVASLASMRRASSKPAVGVKTPLSERPLTSTSASRPGNGATRLPSTTASWAKGKMAQLAPLPTHVHEGKSGVMRRLQPPSVSTDIQASQQVGRPESPAPSRIAMMARKYRLEFQEAKRLLAEVDAFNSSTQRWPTFDDFCGLARRAYEIDTTSHINEAELRKGYKDVCVHFVATDDSFLGWYMTNLFSFPRTPDKTLHEVPLALHSNVFAVENMKKAFYEISDGSDSIDFASFRKVMCALLHAKSEHDVCENRIKGVWKDLEVADGKVVFDDLMDWYLACLAEMGERFDERPDLALAESFYKTYTPPSQQGNRRTKQIFDISNQYKSLAVIAGTV